MGRNDMLDMNPITKVRKHLMLSKVEFAEILGVLRVSLQRWELGQTKPRMKIVRKIKEIANSNNIEVDLSDIIQ